jgi:hypothetical protein
MLSIHVWLTILTGIVFPLQIVKKLLALTPTESAVEALTTALGTGKGGTYSFTVNDARIAYAYPASLGALSTIKDGNGFSLFDSFTRTTQSYTQNGTTVSYYLYVLTDATTVSGYSVTFG